MSSETRAPGWLLVLLAAASAMAMPALGARVGDGAKREAMVEKIAAMGVRDERVLEVLRKVPRHEFVPERYADEAYDNHPLPIGEGQTISQPFVVAYMTEALELQPDDRVLEIGTGSAYQAAVLAELAAEVYTIEIIPELGHRAERTLGRLGYGNVKTRIGDGYQGWPEVAPFDAIIITAAAPRIPEPLIAQLGEGGRLIVPLGKGGQQLILLRKRSGEIHREELLPVVFVPMTGEVEEPPKR